MDLTQGLFGNSIATAATIAVGAAACAAAASIDVRTRRVPNWLTLSTVAFALVLAGTHGAAAFAAACAIVVAGFAAGTLLHAAGLLGGGDVKLLIGVGALVGFPNCVALALYTAVAGGILALVVSGLQGRLRETLRRTGAYLFVFSTSKRLSIQRSAAQSVPRDRLPYAVAIAAGFTLLILSKTYLPAIRIPL